MAAEDLDEMLEAHFGNEVHLRKVEVRPGSEAESSGKEVGTQAHLVADIAGEDQTLGCWGTRAYLSVHSRAAAGESEEAATVAGGVAVEVAERGTLGGWLVLADRTEGRRESMVHCS